MIPASVGDQGAAAHALAEMARQHAEQAKAAGEAAEAARQQAEQLRGQS